MFATAVPTLVRYGAEPSTNTNPRERDGATARRGGHSRSKSSRRGSARTGNRSPPAGLTAIEVAVPSTLLRAGLSLVDMPGTGGMATPQAAMALSAILPTCDAAIVVSDAGQPITASEAEHIDTIRERVDDVLLAKTKIDIHPSWARVVTSDETIMRSHGASTVGVSPALALRAGRVKDRDLAIESRVPEVSVWLQRVATSTRDRLGLQAADAAVDACAHLAAPLEQESAALRDPAGRAERTAQLEAATEEATRLRGAASRWQQVMSDAIADVTNDLADDLRSRFRALLTAAEESVDQLDPATAWVEFEPEFRRKVTETASAHQRAVHERLLGCARRVEAVFSEEEAALDELIPAAGIQSSEAEDTPIAVKELKKAGVGAKAIGRGAGVVQRCRPHRIRDWRPGAHPRCACGARGRGGGGLPRHPRGLETPARATSGPRQGGHASVRRRRREPRSRRRHETPCGVRSERSAITSPAGRRAAPFCRGLARRGEEGGGAR